MQTTSWAAVKQNAKHIQLLMDTKWDAHQSYANNID